MCKKSNQPTNEINFMRAYSLSLSLSKVHIAFILECDFLLHNRSSVFFPLCLPLCFACATFFCTPKKECSFCFNFREFLFDSMDLICVLFGYFPLFLFLFCSLKPTLLLILSLSLSLFLSFFINLFCLSLDKWLEIKMPKSILLFFFSLLFSSLPFFCFQ